MGGSEIDGKKIPNRSVRGENGKRIEVCNACRSFFFRHNTFDLKPKPQHKMRDRILDLEGTGMSLSKIQKKTKINWGTLYYIVNHQPKYRKRKRLKVYKAS